MTTVDYFFIAGRITVTIKIFVQKQFVAKALTNVL